MNSIDLLRTNLKYFLSIHGEWAKVRIQAKQLVQKSLQEINGIKYEYSGNELLFDTTNISDKDTLDILKLYRQIVASFRYSTEHNYKKLLPKIQSLAVLTSRLHVKDKNSDVFMSALQKCRASQNRIICKYNDRGYKASYFQSYEYEENKITELISTFKDYDSVYKNYCLYIAINKICNVEVMLLQTLKGICEHNYDVFSDESDCWAGAMSALKIIDFYYLTDSLTENELCLIELCLLLLTIYIKYHLQEDKLRAMECYANRSRLNERLYKSGLFNYAISRYSERIKTNPVLTKYLCMYDLEQAKMLTPHEFVGEFAENYNYFASQLMMYQNQGLGIVLPNNGDSFDISFNETIDIGKGIADEIYDKLENVILSVFEDFNSNYNIFLKKLRKVVESYYQRVNVGLTNVCCLSWVHQLESYSYFGISKAKFIPIKYHLQDFLKGLQIESSNIEGPNVCEIGRKYLIQKFNKNPRLHHGGDNIPFIEMLLILTDEEDNLKAFRCYGQNFKDWIGNLQRYHMFFGIAVRPIDQELYHLPETLNLTVCFQTENDINL